MKTKFRKFLNGIFSVLVFGFSTNISAVAVIENTPPQILAIKTMMMQGIASPIVAPANIEIFVKVADYDGQVVSVKAIKNVNSLTEEIVECAVYSDPVWKCIVPYDVGTSGKVLLSAFAVDDLGAESDKVDTALKYGKTFFFYPSSTNTNPETTLILPTDAEVISTPKVYDFKFSFTDADGIADLKVGTKSEIYLDGTKICESKIYAEEKVLPCFLEGTNGSHEVFAKVYDRRGGFAVSTTKTINFVNTNWKLKNSTSYDVNNFANVSIVFDPVPLNVSKYEIFVFKNEKFLRISDSATNNFLWQGVLPGNYSVFGKITFTDLTTVYTSKLNFSVENKFPLQTDYLYPGNVENTNEILQIFGSTDYRMEVVFGQDKIGYREDFTSMVNRKKPDIAFNGGYFGAYQSADPTTVNGFILKDGKYINIYEKPDRGTFFAERTDGFFEFVQPANVDEVNNNPMFKNGEYIKNWKVGFSNGPALVKENSVLINSAMNPIENFDSTERVKLAQVNTKVGFGINKKGDFIWYMGNKNIYDLATKMRDVGAVNAFNLDGGASVGFYINGRYLKKPSRKLAVAIMFFKEKKSANFTCDGKILDNTKVRFFQHTNCGGNVVDVNVGAEIPDARYMPKLENDNISSFTIPSGVCVELFQHINFVGRNRVYCNNAPTGSSVSFISGQFENDQLSSVKVYFAEKENVKSSDEDFVVFYEHGNRGGKSVRYSAPNELASAFDSEFLIGNDEVSSFEISPRVCVDMYQDINFGGWKYTYCNFSSSENLLHNLAGGFKENDNLSSFKIRKI
ncbi:MAG: hypothetical protein Fur0024_1750 [Patescibacteria group bacterium]